MSHKHPWRGLFVAAAFLLTTPAFSQEPVIALQDNGNFGPGDNLIVFDETSPQPRLIAAVGEFGGPPGCPIPPGGCPPFPHLPPGGPHFGARFQMSQLPMPFPPFASIDLSDDQIGRLANLKRAFETGISGSFASLCMLEDDMRNKLAADNINESDVRKLAEEIAHQKADMSKRFSAHILESAKVLTPEQRRKIRLMEDRIELGPMGGFSRPPYPPIPPRPPEPGK